MEAYEHEHEQVYSVGVRVRERVQVLQIMTLRVLCGVGDCVECSRSWVCRVKNSVLVLCSRV